MNAHPEPSPRWQAFYLAVCVLSFGCALVRAVSRRLVVADEGGDRKAPGGLIHTLAALPRTAVRLLVARQEHDGQVTVNDVWLLALFFVCFWGLEAWATFAAPYHLYARSFLYMLPSGSALPAWLEYFLEPCPNELARCASIVTHDIVRSGSIPVEVILMEASLAYVALCGTKAVGARPWSRPLLAAVGIVAFDALLDPIAAESYGCNWDPSNAGSLIAQNKGLGIWRWYFDSNMGAWHGIPLYNFAAWYGGAVIAMALPMLVVEGTYWRRRQRKPAGSGTIGPLWSRKGDDFLLLFPVLAGWVVRKASPTAANLASLETVPTFVLMLVVTAFFAGLGLQRPNSRNDPDWLVIAPGVLLLGFSLAARVYHVSWGLPLRWAVGLFLFCLLLVVFPYLETIKGWLWPPRRPA